MGGSPSKKRGRADDGKGAGGDGSAWFPAKRSVLAQVHGGGLSKASLAAALTRTAEAVDEFAVAAQEAEAAAAVGGGGSASSAKGKGKGKSGGAARANAYIVPLPDQDEGGDSPVRLLYWAEGGLEGFLEKRQVLHPKLASH